MDYGGQVLADETGNCNSNTDSDSNQPTLACFALVRLLGVFSEVPFDFVVNSINFIVHRINLAVDGIESGIEDFPLLGKALAYIFA